MASWAHCYYLMRANYDHTSSPHVPRSDLPEERPTDGKVTYRHSCTVTHIIEEGSKVRVYYKRKRNDRFEDTESISADLVIGADGASSKIRQILEPSIVRTYTGYLAFRGTVPEAEVSEAALAVFREQMCFYHGPSIQYVSYPIVGENGNTEPGHRLFNFVCYANFAEGTAELDKIMTDKHGRKRHVTIPPGMMSQDARTLMKHKADTTLPPQMAELVHKTKAPFVQCITDVISPKNLYMNDKVVLIGDALVGLRPHVSQGTNLAARTATALVDWLDGTISCKQFVTQIMSRARLMQARSMRLGHSSQFEKLPVEQYIADRNATLAKGMDEVYPAWAFEGIDDI